MQHPITTIIRFFLYAGCMGLSGIFGWAYKLGPQAIVLSTVFFILAFVVLIDSWRVADADAKEKIRIKKLKKLLGQ